MPAVLVASYMAFDAVECEFWARAENGQKRFNKYLLLNALLGGSMAGMQIEFFWRRQQGVTFNSFIYQVCGAAICLATTALLEWVRRSTVSVPVPPQGAALHDDLSAGRRWTHFSSERSRWIDRVLISLLLVSPIVLTETMSGFYRIAGWPALVTSAPILLPLLLLSMVGTLRIQVNSEKLVLRSGLGFPLLRLNVAEISSITVETLNPMADFGGWGIRSRQGVRAYLFGGSRGIGFERHDGKKYLIACREPEHLAAVLRVAALAGESGKAEGRDERNETPALTPRSRGEIPRD
jgi:hypothetical protein